MTVYGSTEEEVKEAEEDASNMLMSIIHLEAQHGNHTFIKVVVDTLRSDTYCLPPVKSWTRRFLCKLVCRSVHILSLYTSTPPAVDKRRRKTLTGHAHNRKRQRCPDHYTINHNKTNSLFVIVRTIHNWTMYCCYLSSHHNYVLFKFISVKHKS